MPIKFERQKLPSPIKLTETDVVIMKAFHDYGPLSIDHLCLETGKSSYQYMRKRTKMLSDHGYLIRPPIQDEVYGYRTGKGSRPFIHQLGQRGAEYLRDRFGHQLNTSNWDDRAKRRKGIRGQSMFEHDVLANGVLIALKRAYAAREGFEVLSPSDILEAAPVATQEMRGDAFSMPTRYVWPEDNKIHERNVIPDGVFAYRTGGDQPQTWLVFVEFDNDTMPHHRKEGSRTSIQQKIVAYNGLWNEARGVNLPKQRFGIDRFQVMFVTGGSNVHMSNMVQASAEIHRAAGRQVPKGKFFFTTLEEFNRSPNPLEKIWWHCQGGIRGFT